MMVRVTSPKSLKSKLEYDFKEENREKSTILYAQGVSVKEDGYPDLEVAYQEMMAQMPDNVRTKNKVFAVSLNPDTREHLSEEQLTMIGREFMERMGYGEQPFIITRHHDIDRDHIHIVSTRVRVDGTKIPDNHEGRKARRIVDDIEVKYGLTLSPTNQRKQERKQILKEEVGLEAEPLRAGKANVFAQTQAVLRKVLPNSYFQSLGELNALLRKYNLKAEIIQTEYKGKMYDGIIYSGIDEKGNKVGRPLSGSELGRGLGLSAVKHRMIQSKDKVTQHIPLFREKIQRVMSSAPKSEVEFQKKLNSHGLRAEIFKNEQGRIYGITFVEDKSNIAMNGSRIGKAFSANAFNDYFNNTIPQMPYDKFVEQTQKQERIEGEEGAFDNLHLGSMNLGNDREAEYEDELYKRKTKQRYLQAQRSLKKKSRGVH